MNEANDKKWKKVVGGVIGTAVVFGTLALTYPFVFSRSPLPYMATPGAKLKKALAFIQKSNKQKQLNFVDLGSGDGEAILQAAKLGFQNSTGVELNFTLWSISKFRLFRNLTSKERKNTKIIWGDLFIQPLNEANAVLVFGVTPLMRQISQKLRKECLPGTYVLSYRFVLPTARSLAVKKDDEDGDRDGDEDEDGSLFNAEIVYDKEEMRIYKCLQ